MSNAGLFRSMSFLEDQMLRATMPKAAEREAVPQHVPQMVVPGLRVSLAMLAGEVKVIVESKGVR